MRRHPGTRLYGILRHQDRITTTELTYILTNYTCQRNDQDIENTGYYARHDDEYVAGKLRRR
jgi:hypothetical protein